MSRSLSLIVALAIALPLCARPAAERIGAGTFVADTLPASFSRMAVTVRMAPEHGGRAEWAVEVGPLSVGIDMPPLSQGSDAYGIQARVSVTLAGAEEASAMVECDDAYATLKIVYDGEFARVLAGCSEQKEVAAGMRPQFRGGEVVTVRASRPMLASRMQVMSLERTQPEVAPMSMDELRERLAASDDPCEGLWAYLDRNIDQDAATLGGKYELATVKRPDGAYWLIYIGGATVRGDAWRPMMVKGVMRPTIFAGHYDLEWTDANGARLSDDNTAQLSPDGAILTLRFPVYGSQLRFSKALMNSSERVSSPFHGECSVK